MKVRNKWNGRFYQVVSITETSVTLQRDDGSEFTIQKKEYFFNYSEKKC